MKHILLISLILVVIFYVILLCIPNESDQLNKRDTVRGRTLERRLQSKSKDSPFLPKSSTHDALPKVTMTAVEYKIDPNSFNRENDTPPFEFRGGAGIGRVIDREGNVLLDSGDDFGVFGAAVSPDKKKVLVRGGDSGNLVLEPSINRKVRLPAYPPERNMLFIGDWRWVGPNLLFGISGVEVIHDLRGHENCCHENNVARTKFYTFDLLTEQLSEVVMPNAVKQPIVNAVEVTSDGHVHLMTEVPQEGVEQDLGWFKMDASK